MTFAIVIFFTDSILRLDQTEYTTRASPIKSSFRSFTESNQKEQLIYSRTTQRDINYLFM